MKIFIYTLECPISGEIRYIGKTNNIKKRLSTHIFVSKKQKTHKDKWIFKLKKDNKKPIIKIIDEIYEEEWKFWEQHYISLFKSWGFKLLNCTIGGDGTGSGIFSFNFGKKHSEETKEKIKKSKLGKKRSIETKLKISESRKGKYTGENNPNYGKHMSEDVKAKISKANKGKKHSKESIKKRNQSGENHPMFGKKHSEETKNKIKNTIRKNKLNSSQTQIVI